MELTKQPADGSNPEPQPGEFSVLPGKSVAARFLHLAAAFPGEFSWTVVLLRKSTVPANPEDKEPLRFTGQGNSADLSGFDLNQPPIRSLGIMGFRRSRKELQPIITGFQYLANAPDHMAMRCLVPARKQPFQLCRYFIELLYLFCSLFLRQSIFHYTPLSVIL